jgi:membrane protease YdiL (CAAX protease family)
MKTALNVLRIPCHLGLLVLAAVLWDNWLKLFLMECPWTGQDSYQDLAVLRTLECGVLLILWKGQRVSIFGPVQLWWKHFSWGLAISGAGYLMSFGLQWASLRWANMDILAMIKTPVNDTPLPILICAASLCGPLLEELFFRAFLWDQLDGASMSKGWRWWTSLWMVLVFAGLHVEFQADLIQQLPQMAVWLTCGCFSLAMMLWRKSILSAWIVHGMANAVILWPN